MVRPTPMIPAMSVRCIPLSRIRCAWASFVDVIFGGRPPARGRGETDLGASPDKISFEFCESTEDGDEQFATGGGGIDGFGPGFESDTAGGEIFHRLQQVGQ